PRGARTAFTDALLVRATQLSASPGVEGERDLESMCERAARFGLSRRGRCALTAWRLDAPLDRFRFVAAPTIKVEYFGRRSMPRNHAGETHRFSALSAQGRWR